MPVPTIGHPIDTAAFSSGRAWQTLAASVVVVFLSEATVMALLPWIAPDIAGGPAALLDASLLSLLAGPFLWLLLVRPVRRRSVRRLVEMAALVQGAAEGIISLTVDGVVRSLNPAARLLLAAPRDDINTLSDISAASDFADCFQRIIAGDASACLEWTSRRDPSESRTISAVFSAIRTEEAGLIGVALTLHDVTAQRLAERDAAFQKFALDQHAIVVMTDPRGVITYVNERFSAISGYLNDELIGQTHRKIKAPNAHPAGFFADLWATVSAGNVWHGEICNRAKDGSFYWLSSTIVPFMDADGQVERYVAIRTDITRRREAEIELERRATALREARDEAEAATLAKSAFLAMMSHEIRTPMNGLLGTAELLAATQLNDRQRGLLRLLLRSGRTLLALLNDILDLSKMEANGLSLEAVPVNIATLIRDQLSLFDATAAANGITLSQAFDLSTTPAVISGDPTRLRQVIVNLLGNAVKFTQDGSVVVAAELVTERDSPPRPGGVVLPPEETDDDHASHGRWLRFAVRDTGIGMSPQQLARVFEAYGQASGATARKFGGTGLGLHICRQLVGLMGGSIGAVSEAQRGTTFWFTVPYVSTSDEPISTPSSHAIYRAQPTAEDASWQDLSLNADWVTDMVALVVDDNPMNLAVFSEMLSGLGCAATTTDRGEEALDLAATTHFDVIFMDCQMPGIDGLETSRRLRDAGLKLPIIALTAHAHEEDRRRCLAAGMDDYLSKPVSLDDFRVILSRIHATRRDLAEDAEDAE